MELADTEDHITERALTEGAASLVAAGSVLVVVRGMILSHTFPVTKTLVPMAVNQDLKAVTPCVRLSASFLAWMLRAASAETLSRVDEAGHGTKVLRIDRWMSMMVPIPPSDEQLQITERLKHELSALDQLAREAEHATALLQERRDRSDLRRRHRTRSTCAHSFEWRRHEPPQGDQLRGRDLRVSQRARLAACATDDAAKYDRTRALFPEDVFAWVQATQPKAWERS